MTHKGLNITYKQYRRIELGIYQGVSRFWIGILRDTFSVINYSINNI